MKKILFILLLAFLLTACHEAVDYSQVLSEIEIKTEENPDFLSLQVASSSEEDVLNMINTSDFANNQEWNCRKSEEERAEKKFTLYSCFSLKELPTYHFYIDDSKLSAIEIFPSGLSFEIVHQMFGPPTSVYTYVYSNEREIRPTMTMIYQDRGLVVRVLLNLKNEILYIDENVEVINITLLPIEEIYIDEDGYINIGDLRSGQHSKYLYEWQGFGSTDDLYPEVFYFE